MRELFESGSQSNQKPSLVNSRRINIAFGILIAYFLTVALSAQYIKELEGSEDAKVEILNDISLSALSFSEENYHIQLKVWEYVFEPNQRRLEAFYAQSKIFQKKLNTLQLKIQTHKRLLKKEVMESMNYIEISVPRMTFRWNQIVSAVQHKKSNKEIEEVMLVAKDYSDLSKFDKRVGVLVEGIKQSSLDLSESTKKSRGIHNFIEVIEMLFGLMMMTFCFYYMRGLEQISIERQQQVFSSSKFAALGEMAGGIAHEINNPLAIIKNLSGQIHDVLEDEELDRPLLKEMTSKIEKLVDRIAKIISGMRSFSRDGSKDDFQSYNLQKTIEETLSFCSERFKATNTRLDIEYCRKDLFLVGRETEIAQVFLNLLNNAHDAIADQREKWVKVEVVEKPNEVDLLVTDSGSGIPKNLRRKVFQPFFTTKPVGKGTGMGLSISFGIIKAHGGELMVDESCSNTRFIIRLPKKTSGLSKAA